MTDTFNDFLNVVLDVVALLKQFGPFLGAVVFFIWRDWQREDRMSTRITQLEVEQKEIILPLIEKTSETIARNTEAMSRIQQFETEYREVILPLIDKTAETISRNTQVMARNTKVMERLRESLHHQVNKD